MSKEIDRQIDYIKSTIEGLEKQLDEQRYQLERLEILNSEEFIKKQMKLEIK